MTIPLWPDFVMANDLSPDGFGSEIDEICEEIESATKGLGANRQRVIDALATQDSEKRSMISMRYMELYGDDHKKFKNMADLMAKEFSGDFGTALEYLALPPHQAECLMLRKAMKGIGADVDIIWSIMAGRTNDEMEMLKKTFFQMFDKDLSKLLAGELHGNMERLVFNCLQAAEEGYDPEYHTPEKARDDAEAIHKFGQGRLGTNEKGIFKILCASPPQHLELINKEYADKYGYALWKAMEKELGGMGEKNLRQATLYLVGMKTKPHETMSKLIDQACRGFGTNEDLLTCCLIRFQPHLANINACHIEEYSKSIHALIRSEAGGKYKTLLLQIVNTVWPEEGVE
uniref:Annexin n=1 Tax=Entomoneis paludosa TaxID=265537 RepID=A0A7S2Y2K3_9STRA|eukprot:CAMPEP_0172449686 /NCGR_PEP_ID=MMETSP1065-20121228/8327_1 /TAXON_ID=265537 /ORGANISM="Amphiprora paludosa, Strain CCMP125" /LENGTH=344 /DNA_ID=CAMNT_0013201407 /DNA_START=29 /DNA_END=1063 /DNA_ORIENTATION=+